MRLVQPGEEQLGHALRVEELFPPIFPHSGDVAITAQASAVPPPAAARPLRRGLQSKSNTAEALLLALSPPGSSLFSARSTLRAARAAGAPAPALEVSRLPAREGSAVDKRAVEASEALGEGTVCLSIPTTWKVAVFAIFFFFFSCGKWSLYRSNSVKDRSASTSLHFSSSPLLLFHLLPPSLAHLLFWFCSRIPLITRSLLACSPCPFPLPPPPPAYPVPLLSFAFEVRTGEGESVRGR